MVREMERMGYFSLDELREAGHVPPEERIMKGGVVMAECIQNIPCNPCQASCPVGAIEMPDINDNPHVNFDKCIGCRTCIYHCPGLAIFYMDGSGEDGILGLPYEMRPLPEKGEEVELLDRKGEPVGMGVVDRVEYTEMHDRTAVVLLRVDKDKLLVARHFRRRD